MRKAAILERLAQLDLPPADYVIHSSASLVLRGVLQEAGDIDIVAQGSAWHLAEELVHEGAATLDQGTHDQRISLGDDVEVYDGWLGETAASVVGRAELVNGVPCAPLADVVAFKEKLGRPKDKVHLQAIRDFLAEG